MASEPPEVQVPPHKQPPAPATQADLRMLYEVMTGLRPTPVIDDYLYPLSHTGGNTASITHAYGVDPNFHDALADLMDSSISIKGHMHRSRDQKKGFAFKKKGAMLLLMREPANPHDANAIMVLAASPEFNRGGFCWRHVGYVPRGIAAQLAPHWYSTNGIPVIMQAHLHNPLPTPFFTLSTPEWETVRFRDVDFLFGDVRDD